MRVSFFSDNIRFFLHIKKTTKNIDTSEVLSKKRWRFLPFSKVAGKIFLIYISFVLIGGFLLCIPGIVHNIGYVIDDKTGKQVGQFNLSWNFLIGLFTASSAFSDTGLTISTAANDYNFLGQLIILLLIQVGGFGVLTFKVMILFWLGRKISVQDKILVQGERGSNNFGSTLAVIKGSFIFLGIVEFVAALLLFLNFYFTNVSSDGGAVSIESYHNFWNSLWMGIFHSVSAVNNAGFDIIGNSSLSAYQSNYSMQFVFMIEFIVGGLGFPTFYDLRRKYLAWRQKESVKFTLFTKMNLIAYLFISVVGVFCVWLIEYVNMPIASEHILNSASSNWNGFMTIFFNTMSTRNAGFSTTNMGGFLPGSRAIMSIMMFIGSAPSSTAGGIRTTTFAVIMVTIWSIIRNHSNVNAFRRKIPNETVKRAMAVTIISVILVGITVIVISAENSNFDFLNILFMVCSAFGTTGLSAIGQLQMYQIGILSTLFLILMMFIGQLGVSSTLLLAIRGIGDKEYSYVEENILVG